VEREKELYKMYLIIIISLDWKKELAIENIQGALAQRMVLGMPLDGPVSERNILHVSD